MVIWLDYDTFSTNNFVADSSWLVQNQIKRIKLCSLHHAAKFWPKKNVKLPRNGEKFVSWKKKLGAFWDSYHLIFYWLFEVGISVCLGVAGI